MKKAVIHKGTLVAKLWLMFFPKWVLASTFGRHVFTRDKQPAGWVIPHELVHVRQYKEYGIIKFLWIYFWKERKISYLEKTFEKEAYHISSPDNWKP